MVPQLLGGPGPYKSAIPEMHVDTKLSIKRLLTTWSTCLITSFTVSLEASVNVAANLCGSQKTKNRFKDVNRI